MENKERELNMDEMEKASGGTMPDNNLPNQRVEDVLAILHVEPDQGGSPASQPDEGFGKQLPAWQIDAYQLTDSDIK